MTNTNNWEERVGRTLGFKKMSNKWYLPVKNFGGRMQYVNFQEEVGAVAELLIQKDKEKEEMVRKLKEAVASHKTHVQNGLVVPPYLAPDNYLHLYNLIQSL